VLVAWHTVQVPWWDTAADIQEMLDNQQDGTGNEGTDEYVPVAADPYEIDRNAPLVAFRSNGNAQISIQQWDAEKRTIAANASAPGKLVLRLFNYPLWKVEVNGHPVQTETAPQTGQMIVPITAGENRVLVIFADGWDRKVGLILSAVAFIFLVFLFAIWTKSQPLLSKAEN
jgi:hypothetical protein